MKETLTFYRNQLIFCLITLPLGVATGAICALFGVVLLKIGDFRSGHFLYLLPFLGLAGVFIAWCYNRFGKDSAKGMALLFEIHQDKRSSIPLRLIPMVIGSTWLTHLFGGSAGREGVATQIGGTLGSYIGGKLQIPQAQKTLMISGMAAGFGGLFRTPLAAVFFALELLRRGSIEYAALLPALVSAYAASHVSGMLGQEKFTYALHCELSLNLPSGIKLAALGLLFGLVGMAFSLLLKKAKTLLSGCIQNNITRILVFGTAIGLLSIACFQGRYSGPGSNLIMAALSGESMLWDFGLKILFTVFTLAAGYYGGEVVPLFSIGASVGCVASAVLGLPVELSAALGYIGVFGSATNTFLAPVFIGAEVFGPRHLPAFAVVSALAYISNGKSRFILCKNNPAVRGSAAFLPRCLSGRSLRPPLPPSPSYPPLPTYPTGKSHSAVRGINPSHSIH